MVDLELLLKEIEQIFGIGCRMICEERLRQINEEGFKPELDGEHYSNGELIGAAGTYIANYFNKSFNDSSELVAAIFEVKRTQTDKSAPNHGEDYWGDGWPWGKEWDKREKHSAERSAVISGALVASQIDLDNSPENEVYFLIHEQNTNPVDWIKGLNQSGYAGCTQQGMIVDRRQFPNAIVVQPNAMFGIIKPKEVSSRHRFYLIKKGLTFPVNEQELELWEETFKDHPYKLDGNKIDPDKIMELTKGK